MTSIQSPPAGAESFFSGPHSGDVELDPLDHEVPTLGERVAETLRERIVIGAFPPGTRLVEAEIARQLRISRGPVREAMAMLRAEGLVRDEPRRGSYVAALTPEDISEIHDLRAALEGYAARGIVVRQDQEALARLRQIYEEMAVQARAGDRAGYAHRVMTFHAEICRLSGNSRLYQTWMSLSWVLGAMLRLEIATGEEPLESLLAEHEELLTEIEAGDPERAWLACQRHMQRATDHVTSQLRKSSLT
jgi:GntR family transcriptional regulator, gluconate operon transcriptional repressor